MHIMFLTESVASLLDYLCRTLAATFAIIGNSNLNWCSQFFSIRCYQLWPWCELHHIARTRTQAQTHTQNCEFNQPSAERPHDKDIAKSCNNSPAKKLKCKSCIVCVNGVNTSVNNRGSNIINDIHTLRECCDCNKQQERINNVIYYSFEFRTHFMSENCESRIANVVVVYLLFFEFVYIYKSMMTIVSNFALVPIIFWEPYKAYH